MFSMIQLLAIHPQRERYIEWLGTTLIIKRLWLTPNLHDTTLDNSFEVYLDIDSCLCITRWCHYTALSKCMCLMLLFIGLRSYALEFC